MLQLLGPGSRVSVQKTSVRSFSRYYILAFPAHQEPVGTRQTCAAVLEKARLENWAMGKTKVDASIFVLIPEICSALASRTRVGGWRRTNWLNCSQVFLKYYHVEQLNLKVQQATQRVVLLQAYIRGWLGARRYRQTLIERERGALVLQSGL